MSIEFEGFPKIPRLYRDVVIQEKIDGTNSLVHITDDGQMLVGSRSRWITPEQDNFGFAAWAYAHKDELLTLGPGRHFGEWWGGKIQRGYGVQEKRFSLFNTTRFCLHGAEPKPIGVGKLQHVLPPCVGLVPELYRGVFSSAAIEGCLRLLKFGGSQAVPGYMNPEGIVVFHEASGALYKVTLEGDEKPKSI